MARRLPVKEHCQVALRYRVLLAAAAVPLLLAAGCSGASTGGGAPPVARAPAGGSRRRRVDRADDPGLPAERPAPGGRRPAL